MTVIVEQRLRFEFGPSWSVVKYDDHRTYRDGIHRLRSKIICKKCNENARCKNCQTEIEVGTKAVDIVGSYKGQLYLIEVKDFRRHRIENKKRVRDGDLAIEVALKVRDTLAGLAGVCRAPVWQPLLKPIFTQQPKVLFWLEEDLSPDRSEQRGDPTLTLRHALTGRLGWLNGQVMVVDLKQEKLCTQLELEVRSLPDRVYEVRRVVTGNDRKEISRDDFCLAWAASPHAAGRALERLEKEGILVRAGKKADHYRAGPEWERFHEDFSENRHDP